MPPFFFFLPHYLNKINPPFAALYPQCNFSPYQSTSDRSILRAPIEFSLYIQGIH
ncbi:TBC1 domain family, member 10a [Ktedonobacter racemifer DSM 44963]|uniref:TBC1 domain family, member 10a n=1 Tax=Ktedonobacter racemifer DSM 44963 TaxID=485913 RepID=D6TJA4_KTERA|nr:TBC1 domain family, member 10a [Ktedonobacter racemifer DSM 44963]